MHSSSSALYGGLSHGHTNSNLGKFQHKDNTNKSYDIDQNELMRAMNICENK